MNDWMTMETAPKTEAGSTRALSFLGWCPDETAPDGGDIRVVWWEPHMKLSHEKEPRARWWGDRDLEEHPTLWQHLPSIPSKLARQAKESR